MVVLTAQPAGEDNVKISIGRQHSASGEADWRKFSRWPGFSHGSGLATAALLVAFTITYSGSSAARHIGSPKGQKGEISFQLYNGNLIIVKATIGTVKNVNMILDTGTNPTAINQVMADRLNARGKSGLLQTLTGTIHAENVILPGIQIGPLHVDSITGVVEDLTLLERSLGISLGGIAGLDILRSGSFVIDYRRQRIVFGPIAVTEKAVRFETQIPYLSVKAKIAGQDVHLLVDSGTPGLLVYRNRLRIAPKQLQADPNASIFTAAGERTHIKWISSEMSLGKRNLGARNVAIADVDSDPQNDFDGLFGLATMGFRKVSFDFEHGLFGWE
jgi:predicted aspartyl protease